uniref:LAGLIDADG endonuclease n=1 Tax=Morchella brunnea TaxID=1174671 RepID=A0A8K1MEV7_9PEZI|nr:LAGLIDADG endonuclease [Morchella brunnea]UBU98569.1 LAGLIDADG endonuclease [Morchella brunnea]
MDLKLKWSVEAAFSTKASINKKDLGILKKIQTYFGVGNIFYNKKDNCYHFTVASIIDLTNVIIPHFLRYPLLSQKQVDFFLFKSVVELVNAKEHLTLLGLQKKIVNIKASLNKGLSNFLF